MDQLICEKLSSIGEEEIREKTDKAAPCASHCKKILLFCCHHFVFQKYAFPKAKLPSTWRGSGGGVCMCMRVHLCTQKTHCWPASKQHSRLFPTDKDGLVSHSETGPIYCLWLQKTGNRSHSNRECSSLSRLHKRYWLYLTVKSQRKKK